MEIKNNYAFEDFEPWSTAKDTWENLQEFNKISTLECVLEDLYPDGIEETTLNDILRFDEESVYEWVGLYYSEDSGVVSDEPLCECCGKHIPEIECDECGGMICKECVVKCDLCGEEICKDCIYEHDDGRKLCGICWDKVEDNCDKN